MNGLLDFFPPKAFFNLGTAVFALCAAVFWFTSAAYKFPQIITYWGSAPATEPFWRAVKFSAKMNRIAAALSGVSALCAFLAYFTRA